MNIREESTTRIAVACTRDPERLVASVARDRAGARPLRANFRWLFIGNVVYAAGLWLQLVVLARMGGPIAVGAYTFALALAAPVMGLAALTLGPLLASDVSQVYTFREYRGLRVATTIMAMVSIAGIGLAQGLGREAWWVLAAVILMRGADALADVYYAAWQRRERMVMIAAGLMVNALSSLLFMGGAWVLGGGLPGAAMGAALGAMLALALVHARTVTDPQLREAIAGEPPITWARVRGLAVHAAPLGVIVLLGSLQQNVPRYFVRHLEGEAALGSFAAASQLTAVGALVAAVLGSAASPRLGKLHAAGDGASFGALVRRLVLAAGLMGLAGVSLSVVAGRPILGIVYRAEFGESARLLVILSVAATIGFVSTVLSYALTAARAISVQPVVHAIALAVLFVGCAGLVPRHGAMGAAWALAASSSVQAVASGFVLYRWIVRPGANGARATGHPGSKPAPGFIDVDQ